MCVSVWLGIHVDISCCADDKDTAIMYAMWPCTSTCTNTRPSSAWKLSPALYYLQSRKHTATFFVEKWRARVSTLPSTSGTTAIIRILGVLFRELWLRNERGHLRRRHATRYERCNEDRWRSRRGFGAYMLLFCCVLKTLFLLYKKASPMGTKKIAYRNARIFSKPWAYVFCQQAMPSVQLLEKRVLSLYLSLRKSANYLKCFYRYAINRFDSNAYVQFNLACQPLDV